MFDNILVPVDGSEHAKQAVEAAAKLAEKFGSQITLLHIMPRAGSHRVPDELKKFARVEHLSANEAQIFSSIAEAIVNRAKDQAQSLGAKNTKTAIETGDPATTIIDYSNAHDIDIIVMGRRGLGELAGLFMGSVSHKVAHGTVRACLTVGVGAA